MTLNKIVSIESECNDQSLSKCHPQHQSSLFALPKELRLLVYEYVSLPTLAADGTRIYEDVIGIQDLRGRRASFHDSLALPQTCRLAWLEAGALALRSAPIALFVNASLCNSAHIGHSATDHRAQHNRIGSYLNSLTPLNLKTLAICHIDFDGEAYASGMRSLKLVDFLCRGVLFAWPRVLSVRVHFAGTSFGPKRDPVREAHVGRLAKTVMCHNNLRNVSELSFELPIAFSEEDAASWERSLRDPEYSCLGWTLADAITLKSSPPLVQPMTEITEKTTLRQWICVKWRRCTLGTLSAGGSEPFWLADHCLRTTMDLRQVQYGLLEHETNATCACRQQQRHWSQQGSLLKFVDRCS